MQTNRVPAYDASDNPTDCCPRFNPAGWDDQELHFQDKLFVKATTKSQNHVPIDMGQVFESTFAAIEKAGAYDENDTIILSRDVSPAQAEHFFAVSKPVPGQENVRWSGHYLTKVFEGPFEDAPQWEKQLQSAVEMRNNEADRIYYFYTTCPKCAQTYGKNYVVAVAALSETPGKHIN
ncbi:MAG: hypothetical protein GY789_21440 [Hyphomicrobiales bacterium]|nr:hypothetical protein [Hyphomicrobiales bacterium]MCP4998668.1 hypothetical protein [Hyphomicrobiales bacterium]